jgi:hypothetical protein
MDKHELQDRTKQFALRVLKLIDVLPRTAAGRGISSQLEADESLYWLELVRDSKLLPENKLSLLLKEADELTAILASGRKSAVNTSNIKHRTSYMAS